MKYALLTLVAFTSVAASAQIKAPHNYNCISQELEAVNSDIYYDLSPGDIDEAIADNNQTVIDYVQSCDAQQKSEVIMGFEMEFSCQDANVDRNQFAVNYRTNTHENRFNTSAITMNGDSLVFVMSGLDLAVGKISSAPTCQIDDDHYSPSWNAIIIRPGVQALETLQPNFESCVQKNNLWSRTDKIIISFLDTNSGKSSSTEQNDQKVFHSADDCGKAIY